MPFITRDQAKTQLNIPLVDTSYDTELDFYVGATRWVVERHVGEIVDVRAVVEEHELCNARKFVLDQYPVKALTTVARVDATRSWSVSNLHVNKYGRVTVLSGPYIDGLVSVEYQAGWDSPPGNYTLGGLTILQHMWETKRGSIGTVRGMVVGGEETYDQRFATYAIPRKALEQLGGSPPQGG